jgi:hypothetical protein
MNRNPRVFPVVQPWLLLLLLQTVFTLVPQSMLAQLQLAFTAAPAIQNLSVVEATITDGYKARLLPQAGILGSYGIAKGFSARVGVRYEAHGFKYRVDARPDSANDYLLVTRMDYAKAALGGSYGGYVAERFMLSGAVDVVFGLPFAAHYKHVRDGRLLTDYKVITGNFNNYWGLDMGLSLQYQLPNGMGIALSPTFQTQINKVFDEGSLMYKFVGFAPRVEVYLPLSKTK